MESFEPLWTRNYIERVELTLAEIVGVEGRGPFYEKAGALRDILQNHAMEVLALIAMEPPESFQGRSRTVGKVESLALDCSHSTGTRNSRAVWAGDDSKERRLSAIARKIVSNPNQVACDGIHSRQPLTP